MKQTNWLFLSASALGVLGLAPAAPGGVVISVTEGDGEVAFVGGGTLDLSMWTFLETASNGFPVVQPDIAMVIGPFFHFADLYTPPAGFSGPGAIGPGAKGFFASAVGGDNVGIAWGGPQQALSVPVGYVSGGAIEGSNMRFFGETFASIGLTPGTYTWTWDTASGAGDFFTIRVVPGPGAAVLLAGAPLAALRRRRA